MEITDEDKNELMNLLKIATSQIPRYFNVINSTKESWQITNINECVFGMVFEKYIHDLAILMNCIYWDARYPRLITKKFIKWDYKEDYKLQIIGDISIDINEAIEFTEKSTISDTPSFIYNPKTNSIKDGVEGEGIVIMGVDNLPCELPRESSHMFSTALFDFIPEVVKADFTKDFDNCKLPPAIKKAVILYHGKLTPDYQYIDRYI